MIGSWNPFYSVNGTTMEFIKAKGYGEVAEVGATKALVVGFQV